MLKVIHVTHWQSKAGASVERVVDVHSDKSRKHYNKRQIKNKYKNEIEEQSHLLKEPRTIKSNDMY